MEQFDKVLDYRGLIILSISVFLFPLLVRILFKMIVWAKGMPKKAYLFIGFFTLLSIFPIPPPQFKNVEKAKQEQIKRKEDSGDPPEDL